MSLDANVARPSYKKELYYTKYPLLISVVYANSSPDTPDLLLTERKSWVSFEIKEDLKIEEVSNELCLLKESK